VTALDHDRARQTASRWTTRALERRTRVGYERGIEVAALPALNWHWVLKYCRAWGKTKPGISTRGLHFVLSAHRPDRVYRLRIDQDHREVMILKLSLWRHRLRRRRAAYSICAAAKTLTIAATVACSFAGSTTVGLSGQMIKIASGVSGGWTSVMVNRSALVT
jgi:hypothetical protein